MNRWRWKLEETKSIRVRRTKYPREESCTENPGDLQRVPLKDSAVHQPKHVRQVLKAGTGCVLTRQNRITPYLAPLGKVLINVLFQ